MKELVVILAVLGMVAGGLGRIRAATAQSPAPTTSERAAASAACRAPVIRRSIGFDK